jgi:hypothetical protein
MSLATRFLLGEANTDGRTVETVVHASDAWLEHHHDWVQWAFPNQDPSFFNDDAPVWTAEEAAALPPAAVENLRRLLARFVAFLDRTDDWRAPSDHNHARITRVLLCLRDAGLHAEATAFYALVTATPEPGERSRRFWKGAAPA